MLSNARLGKQFWAEALDVYYHVKESKLDPRVKKALFMGITSGIKGFRLWCPEMKNVIFSRDMTFDESPMMVKLTNEAV